MSISVSKPTCFYHPVKVVFLDDNQAFLDALSFEFCDHKNMVMLTNPDEAMALISQSREDLYSKDIERNIIGRYDDESDLQNSRLVDTIFDNARFDNVAVLVVDYDMPQITGVQFCEKLKNINIFKILLTAEADKDVAINAFNKGVIDKFILKGTSNLHQEITTAINELTEKYFYEYSKEFLKKGGSSLKAIINDESYKKVFSDVLNISEAVEYYLVDRLGSFLFLSKYAEPTWLIVCDQRKSDENVDLLLAYEFDENTVDKIRQKNCILFLFSDGERMEASKNWEKYIFEAKKLDDSHSYSIVGVKINSIPWQNITSYEDTTSI